MYYIKTIYHFAGGHRGFMEVCANLKYDKAFNFKLCFGIYNTYTRNILELIDKYRSAVVLFLKKNGISAAILFMLIIKMLNIYAKSATKFEISTSIIHKKHYRPYCNVNPSGCRTIT